MSRPDLEDKLTPAARQALEELVTEYRDRLLLGARESASRLGELREISVHDIMTSFGRGELRWRPFSRAIDQATRLYVWSGLAVAAGALLFLVGREAASGKSLEQNWPLLSALVGMGVAAFGYIANLLLSRRLPARPFGSEFDARPPFEYVGRYLALWRDLELALRDTAASQLGESAANAPMSILLEVLDSKGVLSDRESDRLRELLALRNSVVHGRGDAKPEDLEGASRDSERILGKLRGQAAS